jgi:hypothetical protein
MWLGELSALKEEAIESQQARSRHGAVTATGLLALDSLTSKGILLRRRHTSEERGDEANEYALNIAGLDP